MKTLIVGRTGELPKAKNNKDCAMKSELLGILDAPMILKTPPPSPEKRNAAAEQRTAAATAAATAATAAWTSAGSARLVMRLSRRETARVDGAGW
jgi:hypothetical protein